MGTCECKSMPALKGPDYINLFAIEENEEIKLQHPHCHSTQILQLEMTQFLTSKVTHYRKNMYNSTKSIAFPKEYKDSENILNFLPISSIFLTLVMGVIHNSTLSYSKQMILRQIQLFPMVLGDFLHDISTRTQISPAK